MDPWFVLFALGLVFGSIMGVLGFRAVQLWREADKEDLLKWRELQDKENVS